MRSLLGPFHNHRDVLSPCELIKVCLTPSAAQPLMLRHTCVRKSIITFSLLSTLTSRLLPLHRPSSCSTSSLDIVLSSLHTSPTAAVSSANRSNSNEQVPPRVLMHSRALTVCPQGSVNQPWGHPLTQREVFLAMQTDCGLPESPGRPFSKKHQVSVNSHWNIWYCYNINSTARWNIQQITGSNKAKKTWIIKFSNSRSVPVLF